VGVPCGGDVPGRQPSGLAALAELVGPFVADCSVQGVSSFIGICSRPEEGDFTLPCPVNGIVAGVLLVALFEVEIVIGWQHAHLVLHADTVEPGLLPVHGVGLHTSEQIDDVILAEHVVVACRGSEVVAFHRIFSLTVEASHRQHGNRQGVRLVRIGVEPRIRAAHRGIVHCPESPGLVRIVRDSVALYR